MRYCHAMVDKFSLPSDPQTQRELQFDGPIPAHLTETAAATALAERGALAMLERMLTEYLDEAERLERRIAELGNSECDRDDWDVAQARYAASVRSAAWAMKAVAAQRVKMGLAPHPIAAAIHLVQAAD